MKRDLISALVALLVITYFAPAQTLKVEKTQREIKTSTLGIPPAYRGGTISWTRDFSNFRKVTFNVTAAFRLSDLNGAIVGDLIDVGSSFNWGDGTQNTSVRFHVEATVPSQDVAYGRLVDISSNGPSVNHTYAATGNYTAFWEGANRLPTASNFSTSSWRSETTVRVAVDITRSPTTSALMMIYVQDNNPAVINLPFQSYDNSTTMPTIGTAADFVSAPTDPAALMAPVRMTLDFAGTLRWDIRNSVRPEVAAGQSYYVGIHLNCSNGVVVPLELLILVVPDTNLPPVNYMPGPQMVARNGTLTFGSSNFIYIDDPDGQGGNITTTLRVLNGTLTLSGTDGLTFSSGDGVGDATMTMTGTPTSVVNAMFGMTYRPTPEYAGSDTFTLITNDNGNTGGPSMSDTDTFQITVLAPTAANVSISGRATTAEGRSIAGSVIQLQRANGEIRSSRTNTFGYYRFNDIPAGESVLISAIAKRHQFALPVQMIHAIDNISGVDFIANP